jgi:MFS family permease
MRSLFPDTTPLRRSPAFRRFFIGQVISLHGSQLAIVALRYQAYDLSNKTLIVGLLAMAQMVPLLAAAIGFGQLADIFDRRRILLITQVILAMTSVALALNARSAHPKLWLLFVLGALSSFAIGIDWPTRSSFVPGLVGEDLLPSAIALNSVLYSLAAVVGPIFAGFVVQHSISTAYWLDALSYLVLFAMIAQADPQPRNGSVKMGFAAIGDGFSYLKSNRLLQSTFLADIGAMVFGLPDALFPAMARNVFKGGAKVYGYLQAAPGVGALLAASLNGWTRRIRRQGRAVIWSIAVWGLAIAGFGFTKSLPLALFFLALAGAADAISAIFRSTITQVTTPDEYRGRLNAIFVAVVRGGPRVGEFESGVVSSLGGLQFAAWTGGLACLAWILVTARLYPELDAYAPGTAAPAGGPSPSD